jgi:hypothetical protein
MIPGSSKAKRILSLAGTIRRLILELLADSEADAEESIWRSILELLFDAEAFTLDLAVTLLFFWEFLEPVDSPLRAPTPGNGQRKPGRDSWPKSSSTASKSSLYDPEIDYCSSPRRGGILELADDQAAARPHARFLAIQETVRKAKSWDDIPDPRGMAKELTAIVANQVWGRSSQGIDFFTVGEIIALLKRLEGDRRVAGKNLKRFRRVDRYWERMLLAEAQNSPVEFCRVIGYPPGHSRTYRAGDQ